MNNFLCLAQNIDVIPVLHALALQPELWDQHRWRTEYAGTPHQDVSDIWLRYSDMQKTSDTDKLQPVIQDVQPVFYPAWHKLPQVRPIIFDLMRRVEGYELGRVLITKLPPGGRILPHSDAVGAYVDAGARYHVALSGKPGSLYRAGDETVCMLTGSCWWFNHKAEHEVINNSDSDRIHLLIDMRLA